ncbi:MAG TPA: beta-propeller domain-containing protein [Nocardioidaceae bacterium]
MRRRSWTALGLGATATVAATALVTGVAGPSLPGGRGLPGLFPAPAAAAELPSFVDCEELRRWYVDAALPHVTPWGLGGAFGPVMLAESRALGDQALDTAAEAAPGPDAAVGSGPTGTNVQEAGVDEPDLAKTDGSLLAHVDQRRVVLTDVSGAEPRRLSAVRLPEALAGAELLLDGDRLVVLGTRSHTWPVAVPEVERSIMPAPSAELAQVLVVDVATPARPRVVHDATFSGSVVSARRHGDAVRLVLSTLSPAIDFVVPRRGRTPRQAQQENERLVRESPVEAWLPTVESTGASTPLVSCGDVRHPAKASGYGTVTVVGFDPDDPATRRTTAVTTSSDLVYSSSERLYLATAQRRGSGVHAFALDGLETTYLASGRVPGTVRDRWSMSEYDGRLRVATALGADPWDPDENAVAVLEQRGSDLVEVGRVAAMGIREQIRSVRWFGDVAVVVTFRQVDPLYTVDLSDPTSPEVLGELKVPGFSSYLHPLGGDLLLGVGQDADRRGTVRGAQASVFDLDDLATPRQVDVLRFGRSTELTASYDPRGLTYLPQSRTVLAALDDWDRGNRLVVLSVAEDGTLAVRRTVPLPGWEGYTTRTLPLSDGRVALVAQGRVSLLEVPGPTG